MVATAEPAAWVVTVKQVGMVGFRARPIGVHLPVEKEDRVAMEDTAEAVAVAPAGWP